MSECGIGESVAGERGGGDSSSWQCRNPGCANERHFAHRQMQCLDLSGRRFGRPFRVPAYIARYDRDSVLFILTDAPTQRHLVAAQ
jgi:hypothetical protein